MELTPAASQGAGATATARTVSGNVIGIDAAIAGGSTTAALTHPFFAYRWR